MSVRYAYSRQILKGWRHKCEIMEQRRVVVFQGNKKNTARQRENYNEREQEIERQIERDKAH